MASTQSKRRAVQPVSATEPVTTRAGTLPSRGFTRWGQLLVACPNCSGPAGVDASGDIWCWACNFTSAGPAGCT
ncbi:MAG: hypothetical protein HZB53_22730 [Chloroflexi bacterium]|nr:hypothetical protein [Chloroflexota bacterium]